MNQAEKEMRYLVEKAGGKWHACDENAFHCDMCREGIPYSPNPNSVDALLEIAEKLEIEFILVYSPYLDDDKYCAEIVKEGIADIEVSRDTPADALRAALFIATGGDDENL